MPKLSFIVPVYNTAPYLARCLDSLLAQSFRDFEILAVDDGSTDESFAILQKYQEKNPEKIRIFQKENGGLSDTRNFALDRAEGEYFSFVDSDDFVTPDFAQTLLEKMEKEGLDMVLCDFYYYYDNKKEVYAPVAKGLSSDPHRETLLSAPMVCLRLFRRELFDTIRFQKGIYYEDLHLTPRLLPEAKKVGFVPQALYYYYQRSGSIMHRLAFSPRMLDIFTVLEEISCHYEKIGKFGEYEKEIEYLYIEHLLRTASLRFSTLPNAKEMFDRIRKTMKNRFPNWRKNPYLPKVSFFFRLTAHLAGGGHRHLVKILAKLKG